MRVVKPAEAPASEQSVGDLLREARARQGLSVRALAARAGCSPSFISQVERGQASPSISSLERLVQALGLTLGDFFRATRLPVTVVRSHERATVTNAWSQAQIEALGPGVGHALEPMMIVLAPGGRSGSPPYALDSEVFALVFEGDVLLTLGETAHRLARGDAATFPAETPHRWENMGGDVARVVVVSSRAR
jgi:transcriptional regulator with XRE-family HTH domain